ncbi:MAG: hypothetical protein MJ188_08625 [Treponema sp.]|nr:hypothetical protein [Treponema sp.]
MKKFLVVLFIFVNVMALWAKGSKKPEWLKNFRSVFPDDKYLAAQGEGESEDVARINATGMISRYFSSLYSSDEEAKVHTKESSLGEVEERRLTKSEQKLESNVSLFGLEFTEPYYLKSEQKWFCVAYINKEKAWNQFQPQVEVIKNSFDIYYKNFEEESEPLLKILLAENLLAVGKDLISHLYYIRVLNQEKEKSYHYELDKISNIPIALEKARKECRVFIESEDYNRIISSILSETLEDFHFNVVRDKSKANYTAFVAVDDAVFGSDPYAIKPAITVNIEDKNGVICYSKSFKAEERTLSFTINGAREKAYPVVGEQMKKEILKDFSFFSLANQLDKLVSDNFSYGDEKNLEDSILSSYLKD